MFFEAYDIYNPVSAVNLEIFRMEIQNASTTSSKSINIH